MRPHSVHEAYAVPRQRVSPAEQDRLSARGRQVWALLVLAPRSGGHEWSRYDLRLWVELTERITDDQIEGALTLATAWGARDADQVAVAAHVLLVRAASTASDEDSTRTRRNIDLVCAHLRDHMRPDLAARLPGPDAPVQELSSAVVWAYFFACLALLILVIDLTR